MVLLFLLLLVRVFRSPAISGATSPYFHAAGVIEFDVRENHARAKVRLVTQDGVVETLKTNTIVRILPIAVLPNYLFGPARE